MAAHPYPPVYEYVGECHLNTVIGSVVRDILREAGVNAVIRGPRHCEGVANCLKALKQHTQRAPRHASRGPAGFVYVIDLEEDESLRGLAEETLKRLGCRDECVDSGGGGDFGVTAKTCRGQSNFRVIAILFDRGPERVAERAGLRVGDAETRRILKSRRLRSLVFREGCPERVRACQVVRVLAEITADCLAQALRAGPP